MKHLTIKTALTWLLVALSLTLVTLSPEIAWADVDPVEFVEDVPVEDGNQGGRTALALLDYSLGLNNDNNCLSCTFIQQFILALTSFSAAVFMYFRAFFVTLIPILMAIWIGWNTGKLMIAGGADGRGFMLDVVKKATLFFFLWNVMILDTGSTSRDPSETMTIAEAQYPWSWFGPDAMEYAFQLGNEVRNITSSSLTMTGVGGGDDLSVQIGFNCRDIADNSPQLAANRDAYGFAYQASEVTCAIERTHMVGIAAGLAMIEGSWSQIAAPSLSLDIGNEIGRFFAGFLNAIILTIIGLCLLLVFALSAIWFIFLVLDIVVKILIIAAVSPLLLILALLKPTRQYAWTAVKATIGAMVTALGLAIVGSLAFFLIMNTVNVYNTAQPIYNSGLEQIEADNAIAGLREFIYRMQIDNPSDSRLIPMNLTTPWFHYMILVSLAIFALGKKIIKMIESIIGAQGLSEMADNAKKLAVIGGGLGLATAYTGLQVGKTGLAVGGQAGALGLGAAGKGAGALGRAAGSQSERLAGMSDWLVRGSNPFGKARRDARMMGGGAGFSKARTAADIKNAAERTMDDLGDAN